MLPRRYAVVLFIFATLLLTYALSLVLGRFRVSAKKDAALEAPSNQFAVNTGFITTNVAVIIEDRPLDNVIPLLLHYSSVLGPDWPVILFTSQTAIPDSAPLLRAFHERRVAVRSLPADINFQTQEKVSGFLTSPWIWEQLAPAGHVLIFQADSIICSRSPQRVNDFLKYDFVGAPIVEYLGQGYNGGLSLRNRSMVLDIVRRSKWVKEYDQGHEDGEPNPWFEDQWFYKKMKELPDQLDGQPGARLPTRDEAMAFAVETIWFDRPLGFHQVHRFQADHLQEVEQWCPEYKMALTDLLIRHGDGE